MIHNATEKLYQKAKAWALCHEDVTLRHEAYYTVHLYGDWRNDTLYDQQAFIKALVYLRQQLKHMDWVRNNPNFSKSLAEQELARQSRPPLMSR